MAASVVLAGLLLTVLLMAGYELQPGSAGRIGPHVVTANSLTPVQVSTLPVDVRELFAVDGQLRQDFWLEVHVLGAAGDATEMRLQQDDQIVLRVQSDRDCFLTLLSCGEGAPVQLFPLPPLEGAEDARHRAGETTTIPKVDEHRDERVPIRATLSKGKEALCLLASTLPVSLGKDASGAPLLVFATEADRDGLRSTLRGLLRQVKSDEHEVSQIVIPYRVTARPDPSR
jgi:hypothetical protein